MQWFECAVRAMKGKPASSAKVTLPILGEVFPRERLFQELDRMREKSVIWVTGPPGSGKTTLVISYLNDRGLLCLWYQIDLCDTDPATFFYYMSMAAKKAALRKGQPLAFLTPEYQLDIPTFTLKYFEGLYNRLPHPSVLVFDDYQEVPTQSPFHEVICFGFSYIPDDINVILISRGKPPASLARFHANKLMEVLEWRDLKLTFDETHEIARLQIGGELSHDKTKELHRTSDGWAAGLILILKNAEVEGVDLRESLQLPPEEIFVYFAGEAFDKMAIDTQTFLLKTAFLPVMNARMIEDLTELPHVSHTLSELNSSNYFIERCSHIPSAYQYHPLFREFLLSRARERFPLEEITAISYHAALLLEEADQIEAAIDLLQEIDDMNTQIAIIMKRAPTMLSQRRNDSLGGWLNGLPESTLENTPWLLYWMGACRLPSDPSSSLHCFERAFEQFRTQENPSGTFLSWSGIVDAISYNIEDFTLLIFLRKIFGV
ncbi:MAG: hypothetical protein SVY10_09470 [Thermodesulfobacteriota bacterium]|nr:hypothetical protein [Thermodesulfobacteriota bacterium]